MIADDGGTLAVAPEATRGGGWARSCDSCWSAPCAVYCRADAAYLCAGCDALVHAANRVASRHERVWVCEGCKRAPAAITCRADAAVLCTACDADVHSANPLARRHRRVPVLPLRVPSLDVPPEPELEQLAGKEAADNDDEEAASWLLLDSGRQGNNESNAVFLFGAGDVDEYLDLDYNSGNENQNNNKDDNQLHTNPEVSDQCIVPVPSLLSSEPQHKYEMVEIEYDDVSKAEFSYAAAASLSHSMSFSSKDASVVPDTTMTDVSNSYGRNYNKGTIDLFSSPPLQIPPQFAPMDREARVLRYREKKKMRKFEKTIRYASRKAYAETRPRIKGRFAKRSDVELEVDQLFSTALISEGSYSIVPSF